MKKFAIAAALLVIGTANAMAAPPPVARWTGCYIGVNVGYGWNDGRSRYEDPNTTPDPINGIQRNTAPFALFIPVPSPSAQGGLVGGTAGCNWQSQQWVFGIEGDFDAAFLSGSRTTLGPRTAGDAAINGYFVGEQAITANIGFVASAREQVSLQWMSTARGRVGFAVQDRLLMFATGGLAVGRASAEGLVDVSIPGSPPGNTWTGANSATLFGYAVGGGAEWALSDRISAKAEYLWYDLGNIKHPLNCVQASFGCNSGVTAYSTLGNTSSSVRGNIVRVGINYKFN